MADEIRHQEHGQFKAQLEVLDDLKYKVQELDDSHEHLTGRVQTLEEWRDGIGKQRGAETRLQDVEASVEVAMRIADSRLEGSIQSVLDKRERTVLAYIKAIGPLAGTLLAIALAVLAATGVKL